MQEIKVQFPVYGVSDAFGREEQPELTSIDARNVRAIDPITGSVRGAQRSGTAQHVVDQLTAEIRYGASFAIDDRKLEYAETASAASYSKALRSKKAAQGLAVDRYGNQYYVDDGNTVTKYNADGYRIYTIAIPVEDKAHRCRAITADQYGNFYVAVSGGGDATKAKIWKYRHDQDSQVLIDWTVDIGRFVADLAVNSQNGYLYVGSNAPREWQSFLTLYTRVDTSEPEVGWEREVAYPVNAIGVRSDGGVYTTHEANANRGLNPFDLTIGPKSEDWTPKNLANYQDRINAWFKADQGVQKEIVAGSGVYVDVEEDGDIVSAWRDMSGFNRDFFQTSSTAAVHPTWRKYGFTGKPTLKFDAASTQWMQSGDVKNTKSNHKDVTKQVIPGWEYTVGTNGSGFLVAMVVKPTVDQVPAVHPIIGQQNLAANNVYRITANSDAAFAAASGTVMASDLTGAGIFTATTFDNASAAALVLQCIDGFMGAAWTQRTFFNVNGTYAGRFQSAVLGDRNANTNRTQLGRYPVTYNIPETGGGAAAVYGSFEIAELIVLRASEKTPVGATREVIEDDGAVLLDTETNRLVGYLAHRHGLQGYLPVGHIYKTYPPTQVVGFTPSVAELVNNVNPVLAHYDASGVLKKVWPTSTGTNQSGLGYGLVVDSNDDVICCGPAVAPDNFLVTKFTDNGASFSLAWGRTVDAGAATQTYHNPKLGVDKFNNAYVPLALSGNATPLTVRVYDSSGTVESDFAVTAVVGTNLDGYAVAPDPNVPTYTPDAVTRAETFYVATDNRSTGATSTVYAVSHVTPSLVSGQPRTTHSVVIAGGTVYRYDSGTAVAITGATLDSTAEFVDGCVAYGKLWASDGIKDIYYDPIAGTTSTWTSQTNGKMPARCRLVARWRGRCVRARDPSAPHQVHFSALGNFFDWDTAPPIPLATQACDLSTQATGLPPDIVNALVPYTDDLLLIGGEDSILRVTGDPMAGGSIDEITRTTGMAFGRSWAIDDQGVVYFAGSKGGVFRMSVDGTLERLSQARNGRVSDIERRLLTVSQAQYRFELIWNHVDDGLHVFLIPWGSPSSAVDHYFWSRATGGWFPDSFATADVQPTAVWTENNVATTERQMMLAMNSYICRWDRTARDDSGVAIASSVTLGPIVKDPARDWDVRGVSMNLSKYQNGVYAEFYASDAPDDTGTQIGTMRFEPGFNARKGLTAPGGYVWMKLLNNQPNQRWAFERAVLYANPKGERRGS